MILPIAWYTVACCALITLCQGNQMLLRMLLMLLLLMMATKLNVPTCPSLPFELLAILHRTFSRCPSFPLSLSSSLFTLKPQCYLRMANVPINSSSQEGKLARTATATLASVHIVWKKKWAPFELFEVRVCVSLI